MEEPCGDGLTLEFSTRRVHRQLSKGQHEQIKKNYI